jgi:flavodoxin
MPGPDSHGKPTAAVLYTSRFGTTEKVARALESGLKRGGLMTTCVNLDDVTPESLTQYDLLCFGGPTEFGGLSKKMDEFLEEARKRVQIQGKRYFAFDTKSSMPFTGSAAKCIQTRLEKQGLSMIAKRESATVTTIRQGSMITGNVLRNGEEARFEQLGFKIGRELLANPLVKPTAPV